MVADSQPGFFPEPVAMLAVLGIDRGDVAARGVAE